MLHFIELLVLLEQKRLFLLHLRDGRIGWDVVFDVDSCLRLQLLLEPLLLLPQVVGL